MFCLSAEPLAVMGATQTAYVSSPPFRMDWISFDSAHGIGPTHQRNKRAHDCTSNDGPRSMDTRAVLDTMISRATLFQ